MLVPVNLEHMASLSRYPVPGGKGGSNVNDVELGNTDCLYLPPSKLHANLSASRADVIPHSLVFNAKR